MAVLEEANADNELARKARDERCAESMYRLGIMFSTGQGVPYDIIQAHKWFNLSASLGNKDAQRYRKELADEMSADEVAEAQRNARRWLATG